MNVITLRNRSRRKSGVASADYSNTDVLEDFNQAYNVLATLLANLDEDYFEEQHVKFSLIANSGLYSLPTDMIALKQVRLCFAGTPVAPSAYTIAGSYDPSEVHDISADEDNVAISTPMYDLTNNYIRLKPKPTAAVTNGGMLDYIAMPSALVNTGDTPILPIQYHEKIAVYGAMQQAFKFEKWNKHTRLQNEWNSTISELETLLAERDRNRPVRFKTPFEAGGQSIRVREL